MTTVKVPASMFEECAIEHKLIHVIVISHETKGVTVQYVGGRLCSPELNTPEAIARIKRKVFNSIGDYFNSPSFLRERLGVLD